MYETPEHVDSWTISALAPFFGFIFFATNAYWTLALFRWLGIV